MGQEGESIHSRSPKAGSSLTRQDDVMGKGRGGREQVEKCGSKKKKGGDFPAIEKRANGGGFSKITKTTANEKFMMPFKFKNIYEQ